MQQEAKTCRCKRCNRKLKDAISIERGYGAVCYKKEQQYRGMKPLFEYTTKERTKNATH
jgi:protein-arginine kinase activator protein McsA